MRDQNQVGRDGPRRESLVVRHDCKLRGIGRFVPAFETTCKLEPSRGCRAHPAVFLPAFDLPFLVEFRYIIAIHSATK